MSVVFRSIRNSNSQVSSADFALLFEGNIRARFDGVYGTNPPRRSSLPKSEMKQKIVDTLDAAVADRLFPARADSATLRLG
jgi:hypothetical protein